MVSLALRTRGAPAPHTSFVDGLLFLVLSDRFVAARVAQSSNVTDGDRCMPDLPDRDVGSRLVAVT